MYFLGIGIILLLLKYFEIGPVGRWEWSEMWPWFGAPFLLAVVWWAWADWSGYTKKKAMDKMDKRKADRLQKNRDNMGLNQPRRK